MAIYGPLEIIRDGKPTGLWHYCAITGDGEHVYAIGDCSTLAPCPDCKHPLDSTCKTCNGRFSIPKANPCPGHPSPAEARQHYVEYLIRKARRRFDNEENRGMAAALRRCRVCREWTCGNVDVPGQMMHSFTLCNLHNNDEGLKFCLEDRSPSGPAPLRDLTSSVATSIKRDT